jgi:RNA-directed DNA polymerase
MNRKPGFDDIVRGKINYLGMVKGKSDGVYLNLVNKFNKLSKNKRIKIPLPEKTDGKYALVMTEGKTDWKHLKAALTVLKEPENQLDTKFQLHEWKDVDKINDAELLKICRSSSQIPKDYILMCMFDRDSANILKDVMVDGQLFKKWGNKVYSFAIPVPSHRLDNPDVSIELFYSDDEIKRKDSNGRRLFLSNEFSETSGRHMSENLVCRDNKATRKKLCVIDANDKVYDHNDNNVALSKDDFAQNILNDIENFTNFKFDEFKKIFDVMQKIISN